MREDSISSRWERMGTGTISRSMTLLHLENVSSSTHSSMESLEGARKKEVRADRSDLTKLFVDADVEM